MFNTTETHEISMVKSVIKSTLANAMEKMPHDIKLLMNDAVVTGGISASFFHMEKQNDIDVYLKSKTAIDKLMMLIGLPEIAQTVADVNPKYGIETLVDGKLVTAHAVTFKSGIQIITMNTVEDARKLFDFIHCMPFYDFSDGKYYISRAQYDSIKAKHLVLNPTGVSPAPNRMTKYIERGWTL